MNDHKNDLGAMSTRRLLARRRALAERLGSVEEVLAGTLAEQTRQCGKAVDRSEVAQPGDLERMRSNSERQRCHEETGHDRPTRRDDGAQDPEGSFPWTHDAEASAGTDVEAHREVLGPDAYPRAVGGHPRDAGVPTTCAQADRQGISVGQAAAPQTVGAESCCRGQRRQVGRHLLGRSDVRT